MIIKKKHKGFFFYFFRAKCKTEQKLLDYGSLGVRGNEFSVTVSIMRNWPEMD